MVSQIFLLTVVIQEIKIGIKHFLRYYEKLFKFKYQKSAKLWSFNISNGCKFNENKKQGSIIFLGSIYGVVGQDLNIYMGTGIRENLSYSIIKGGLVNFTKQMASYYGKHNIRVNCICPGGIIDKVNSKIKNF